MIRFWVAYLLAKKPAISHKERITMKLFWPLILGIVAVVRSGDAFGGAEAVTATKPVPAKHWSLIAPVRSVEPAVQLKEWPRNAIDRFILARLEKDSIQPSPEADKVTLIRRLYLDLTGLPPKPAEVEAFLTDPGLDAYERLVEKLLASPHYGERWGRHWLDVARYADSNGYSIDAPRSIWKYRDWVIQALNQDLSYDQFVIWQMAGDMLPGATMDQKVATGFHRNTMINEEGGVDKEQFRIESIIDRVNTTGTAILGLSIGCCQCHDHKFDPLKQKEYYQLFAFLNNADEPNLEFANPDSIARREKIEAQIQAAEAEMSNYVGSVSADVDRWQKSLTPEEVAKLRPEITTILETPPDKRSAKQKRDLLDVVKGSDADYKKQKSEIAKLEKQLKMAPRGITSMVMREREKPRDSYFFIKGDFTRHGDPMYPGVPAALPPLKPSSTTNRLDLARWLVDADNPLTARVMVNRLWQEYFGKGLVETENDFGTQGAPPSHPELLDWLATEFMRQKWSLKAMHKLIVTSATYRQSSKVRTDLQLVDANNKLLARQARLRLDAEVVRDVALSASGMLDETVGGPSVYPPQPDGVMTLGQSKREWKVSPGKERYRRGMYTFLWRATPHPDLVVFDAPDATSTCTRRPRSNTPLQALTLLNDTGFFELAQDLAGRVLKEAPPESQLEYAFELCLARKPGEREKQRLNQLLEQQLAGFEASPESARRFLARAPATPEAELNRLAAWTSVSRVLLNLDETITRE